MTNIETVPATGLVYRPKPFALHSGGQRFNDGFRFGSRDDVVGTQTSLSFTAFVAQLVATISAPVLDFPGSGHAKTLLHSLVGFLFWHDKHATG